MVRSDLATLTLPLIHVFLHGSFADKAVDINRSFLSNAEGSVHGLKVVGGVPAGVEDHDLVRLTLVVDREVDVPQSDLAPHLLPAY